MDQLLESENYQNLHKEEEIICIDLYLSKKLNQLLSKCPKGKLQAQMVLWKNYINVQGRNDTNFQLLVDQRNVHNLKVQNYVYLVGILGLQAWETASQVTLRELLQGGEGIARVYRSFETKRR